MESNLNKIRFGMVAVQKGFVLSDKIIHALGKQVKENISSGKHRRIGEILLEQRLIDRSQFVEILRILYKNQSLG